MPDLSRAAGAQLALSLWAWSAGVFHPARALKRAGFSIVGSMEGEEPIGVARRGLGPYFSTRYREPVRLETPSEYEHLVEEFDRFPQVYELIVRPFSEPLFDEALSIMKRYLPPEGRALDAGCGPGREVREVARLVPRGEVVGIDLAVGMVEAAHASARAHGLDNTAFSRPTSESSPLRSAESSTSSTAASPTTITPTWKLRLRASSVCSAPAVCTASSIPGQPGSTY